MAQIQAAIKIRMRAPSESHQRFHGNIDLVEEAFRRMLDFTARLQVQLMRNRGMFLFVPCQVIDFRLVKREK